MRRSGYNNIIQYESNGHACVAVVHCAAGRIVPAREHHVSEKASVPKHVSQPSNNADLVWAKGGVCVEFRCEEMDGDKRRIGF